ncbi:MAG: transcriptional repressor LexA [Acidobacteria bacterium]|nr:transcriptional repressor LexA [Acidobacteriota bacterium]
MERALTPRQQRVLDFILERTREDGAPPTLREIGQEFGFRSTGTVRDYLSALEAKGFLKRAHRKARAIDVEEKAFHIPILGRVAAGAPIWVEENIESYLPFGNIFTADPKARLFALRVKGDSMEQAGILDGDLVVARAQELAHHRDVVVALHEGEVTVKELRVQDGHKSLHPANPRYAPIVVGERTQVLGKVIASLRFY